MQNPDSKSVFEKLQKTQEAYMVQKTYNRTLEEILAFERQQSLMFRDKLIKATKSFLALDKVHKSSVERLHSMLGQYSRANSELDDENEKLKASVAELQEQCDHLRAIQLEHNQDAERIWKLEEDLEVAKAQQELQQEAHREEIDSLKKRHISEMLKYKISFESARQKFKDGKRIRLKKGSRGAFRWPSLGVEKIGPTQVQEEAAAEEELFLHPEMESITKNPTGPKEKSQVEVESAKKKRRKLFYQSKEEVVDLAEPKTIDASILSS